MLLVLIRPVSDVPRQAYAYEAPSLSPLQIQSKAVAVKNLKLEARGTVQPETLQLHLYSTVSLSLGLVYRSFDGSWAIP